MSTLICSRKKVHDGAVKEIFRMSNQANITAIMEPEGLMWNDHRPAFGIKQCSK